MTRGLGFFFVVLCFPPPCGGLLYSPRIAGSADLYRLYRIGAEGAADQRTGFEEVPNWTGNQPVRPRLRRAPCQVAGGIPEVPARYPAACAGSLAAEPSAR